MSADEITQLYERLILPLRLMFHLGGFFFFAWAVGVEMIGARLSELEERDYLPYLLAVHLEELLEMIGVLFFLHGLMSYIATQKPSLQIVAEP